MTQFMSRIVRILASGYLKGETCRRKEHTRVKFRVIKVLRRITHVHGEGGGQQNAAEHNSAWLPVVPYADSYPSRFIGITGQWPIRIFVPTRSCKSVKSSGSDYIVVSNGSGSFAVV